MSKILPRQILAVEDVAVKIGEQETPNCAPWFGRPMELFNLVENIGLGLMVGSTFSRSTLENALKLAA